MLFKLLWLLLLLLQLQWPLVVWYESVKNIETVFGLSLLLSFGLSAALLYGYDRYRRGKKISNKNAVAILLATIGVILVLGSIWNLLGETLVAELFTYLFGFGLFLLPFLFIAVLVVSGKKFVFASKGKAVQNDREV